MNDFVKLLFLLTLQGAHSMKYLYGPDSEGRAALIDLQPNAPPTSCSLNLPKLPIPDLGCFSSAFIDGRLTICGGSRTGFTSSKCFALNENREWVNFPSLPEPRNCAISHVFNNGSAWWITGGDGSSSGFSTSVIYVAETGTWQTGIKMPILGYGYCLVQLKDGRFMLLAGYRKIPIIKPIYNTQVFIFENKQWIKQEGELNRDHNRYGLSQVCSRTPDGNSVMLLGGKPRGENHVEVWNSEYGFWNVEDDTMGLPLEHVWYPSTASDESGNVYVIGGESPKDGQNNKLSDRILKWDGNKWSTYENALPFPLASSSIAQLHSDSDISC